MASRAPVANPSSTSGMTSRPVSLATWRAMIPRSLRRAANLSASAMSAAVTSIAPYLSASVASIMSMIPSSVSQISPALVRSWYGTITPSLSASA